MRNVFAYGAALLVTALAGSTASLAQIDVSRLKMVQPSPELPGDRLLSCGKIAEEMGEIMRKRGMKEKVASSKSKICSGKKTLDKQGEEKKALSATQAPALIAASVVGGPAANAVLKTTQAQDAALEAKQRPGRDQALSGMSAWHRRHDGCDERSAAHAPEPAGAGQTMRGVHGTAAETATCAEGRRLR